MKSASYAKPKATRKVNGRGSSGKHSADAKLGHDSQYLDARTREAQARAVRIEQITRKEAGELIDREEAVRVMLAQVHNAREKFLGMQNRLRADFPDAGEDLFARLSDLVHEALTELAAAEPPDD